VVRRNWSRQVAASHSDQFSKIAPARTCGDLKWPYRFSVWLSLPSEVSSHVRALPPAWALTITFPLPAITVTNMSLVCEYKIPCILPDLASEGGNGAVISTRRR
jgi:hypothetical protein